MVIQLCLFDFEKDKTENSTKQDKL